MSTRNKPEESDHVVYLGYIEDDDKISAELIDKTVDPSQPTTSCSSKDQVDEGAICPWLVNKIGGLPIFPYNGDDSSISELEATLDSMRCKHCKSDCVLIFQINSPVDESQLDRVMQVYACIKSGCTKRSWFALRCMFKCNENSKIANSSLDSIDSKQLKLTPSFFGPVLVSKERSFFEPYYLSVMEEPTGKENFAKNNLEALKLASKFKDPDLKPASIEAKYKNLKNYKPPKPQANLTDLDDFEKFQMEKLYGNDKDMYRFYKRVARYQAQVCRYDWDGSEPLINSNRIKLDSVLRCQSCSSPRKFEFQLMSALINYLRTEHDFDRESIDFSSILIHSCSNNCSNKTYNLEDTYFMPDPDSRIFNKVKQKMIALKLGESAKLDKTTVNQIVETDIAGEPIEQRPALENQSSNPTDAPFETVTKKKRNKKKKNKH